MSKLCKIYTEDINSHRWGKDRPTVLGYAMRNGETFLSLDTTFMTAWQPIGKAFAPTRKIVMDSKQGRITWKEYTEKYTAMMRKSYSDNKELFLKALGYDNLVLKCYCKDTSHSTWRCHRYILTGILLKVAKANGIKAKYMGEVTKNGFWA